MNTRKILNIIFILFFLLLGIFYKTKKVFADNACGYNNSCPNGSTSGYNNYSCYYDSSSKTCKDGPYNNIVGTCKLWGSNSQYCTIGGSAGIPAAGCESYVPYSYYVAGVLLWDCKDSTVIRQIGCCPACPAAQNCPSACGYGGGSVPDGSCGSKSCPATGSCGCTSALQCTGGTLCTTPRCTASVCYYDPKNCADGSACTTDSCNLSTGNCDHVNVPTEGWVINWGSCSVNCGTGIQTGIYSCPNVTGCGCLGSQPADKTQPCTKICDEPEIEAGIITKGNFTVQSKNTNPATDMAIKLMTPIVARGAVTFNRNLGDYNSLYAATAILNVYPKYLYDITYMERTHPDSLNYTGLRSFDVQFDYNY